MFTCRSVGGGMEADPSPAPSSCPSPGVSPVQFSDCIEELVRFTLSSSCDEGAADPWLSQDYRFRLLQHETPTSHLDLNDACMGVPAYPLYRHLARALERSISSGVFLRATDSTQVSIPVDESLKMKEINWIKLIKDAGVELSNMFKAVDFELHVQEPFFTQLRACRKTVEGRCAIGNYNRIDPGALLLVNKCLLLKVQDVKWYNSFYKMLEVETLANALPGVETIEEGVQIYRKFYSEEKESSNGVVAISVSKPASQPYLSMANLLSVLSYDGIGALLGMIKTSGTVSFSLPPPRSSLISSSMKLHQPNVKGCSLTNAARALAKHINRSSEGWWGDFCGNDSNKNSLATKVISQLLMDCCWMNVHLIQPYECVFEVRVREGYGARWSKDGAKFIGFVEPYTQEGYSKRWKH